MASCSEKDPQVEPLWAMNLKDYDRQELETLVSYLDATMAWFNTNGLNDPATEDVVGFRIGMPVVTLTDTLETAALYSANGDSDQLVKSVSVDTLKITVKTDNSGVTYAQPYTFKSSFTHNIFEKYFVEGVDNYTGFPYLDDRRMNLSAIASIPVQYGGVDAKTLPALPIPADIYGCVVYITQNTTLYVVNTGETVTKHGDVTYYSTYGFYQHMSTIRTKAIDTLARIASPGQEDIHELMVYLGVDQAFKDIQFGGDFSEMRIVLRVPASRNNQATLEGLLGNGDVFDEVFKEEYVSHTARDISDSEKIEDLQDVYSADKLDFPELDDSVSGFYGCKNGGSYRYWYVSEAWLESLTPEQLSIIFWMGLDIITAQSDTCPFDELLAIVIVIVITYFTAGLGSGTALTVAQGLTVLSGILSIASITGMIDAETAGILGVALAVTSLGTSLMASGISVSQGFSQMLSIASQVLSTVQTFEATAFAESMEEKQEKMEGLEDDANLWESEFRFNYGASFEMGVRNGPEADPYMYLKDTYEEFSTYTSSGFK